MQYKTTKYKAAL